MGMGNSFIISQFVYSCSSTCTIEKGFTCPSAGWACIPTCGDGYYVKGEACDDGNTTSSDGCSSSCKVESGFKCTHNANIYIKDTCTTTCGDGIKVGSETCDDKNTISGDG